MNTNRLPLPIITAITVMTLSGCSGAVETKSANVQASALSSTQKDSENTDRLWISVRLPSVAKAKWVSDDMAETFADKIAVELRAQGYKGKLGTLRPEDSAPSRASVLVVQLLTWTAKDGVADCTFTASVRTSEGDRDLGFFNGDNMIVTADGEHRISSDGLLGSAQEAMNDLYARIKATSLIKTD